MTEPLPYLETFSYADGSGWPTQWNLSPFYTGSIVPDVQGGRGRVPIVDPTASANQFAYRIYITAADPIDVAMQIDISEVVTAFTTSSGDPYLKFQVALRGAFAGRAAYELYVDPYGPLTAGIVEYDSSGQQLGTPTVSQQPAVDPAAPILLRVVETGNTARRFKVWQGTEPADSTADLLLTTTDSALVGDLYIDLLVAGSADGAPHVYLDDITAATVAAPPPPTIPPPDAVPPVTFINPATGMVTHYLDSFTVDLATGGMNVNTRSNLEVTGL